MRSLIKVFAVLLLWSSGAWITPNEASAQQGPVTLQVFYDALSPYGMWVNYPHYGYVWIPDRDPGFSPYATSGYWVFTDYGWTWVSDYPWGWAPFHYGRWDYDNTYGWLWVPDGEWGPAWVSWRRSPGYYGWAPLRPGISMSIAFGRDYHERNERWTFVRDRDITGRDKGRHYVDRANNAMIIRNSTLIVNTRKDNNRNATYIAGPDRDDIQKFTHTTIKSVTISETDKPGHRLNNDELHIYRPQIQRGNGNGQAPAPSKVMKLNDVKPVSERKAGNRQEQPPAVKPPEKGLAAPPRGDNPSDKGKEQKPSVASPPTKGQPVQSRNVNPSNNRGKGKPPQNVAPSNKNRKEQPSRPSTNQDENEKVKRGK